MVPAVIKILVAGAAAASLLSACGSTTNNRQLYDGVPFKAKAKPVDKKTSLALFSVEIDKASRSLQGAREAAHHAGVSYCLTKAGYGTSNIIWDVDPYDPEAPLRMVGDTAVFQGKCDP